MTNAVSDARWARIALFAMDVDGILTDGRVSISSDGTESKTFSILDGLGLTRLHKAGIPTAWISGRASEATTVRARELGIAHLIQDRIDKKTCLEELLRTIGLDAERVCYMGDDVIDLPAMEFAGIGATVPEAAPAIRKRADWVTSRHGGTGAVREICDLILAARNPGETPGS